MGHYKSNLRDIEFNLFEVFGAGDRLGKGPFAEMDEDTARYLLGDPQPVSVYARIGTHYKDFDVDDTGCRNGGLRP